MAFITRVTIKTRVTTEAMKIHGEKAAKANKVNSVSGAGVDAKMIANKNAIKAALEKAIHERMLAKTRKVVGNQTLHKTTIDQKMSLNE